MIVIADTSPINYLLLIGEVEILPKLFGDVLIPQAVLKELSHEKAPDTVKAFVSALPVWLRVELVEISLNSGLEKLDPGEREAIYLAETTNADLLIIDERKGFNAAKKRNLKVAGTVAILEEASLEKLIDLKESFDKLKRTSFHISPDVLDKILDRYI